MEPSRAWIAQRERSKSYERRTQRSEGADHPRDRTQAPTRKHARGFATGMRSTFTIARSSRYAPRSRRPTMLDSALRRRKNEILRGRRRPTQNLLDPRTMNALNRKRIRNAKAALRSLHPRAPIQRRRGKRPDRPDHRCLSPRAIRGRRRRGYRAASAGAFQGRAGCRPVRIAPSRTSKIDPAPNRTTSWQISIESISSEI
jgi:hypothetical protein